MEQLVSKYTKFFYITLIISISWQLSHMIFMALQHEADYTVIGLIVLSIVNIIILCSSLVHNVTQRFTECKATAKVLRLTLPLLILFQILFGLQDTINLLDIINHLATLFIVQIALDYRIKSIEYLEKLAGCLCDKK